MNGLKYIVLLWSLFLLISCNDDISYFSEFEQEEVLYCIIDANSNVQNAIVKRSYEDKNQSGDTYIQNVQISLSSLNKSVMLTPVTGDGITTPAHYYSTDNFKPVAGSEISISAILPDQRELKSSLTLPRFSLFYFDQNELAIPLDELTSNYLISWNTNNLTDDIAFLSVLYIDYSVLTAEGVEVKRIEVPSEYKMDGNERIPIYPSVTENNFQSYTHSAVDYTLRHISEGDTNKSNYKIIGGALQIYILEENLATYFASSETFKNTYTVKVFETIVSNIDGGKGIFGAFIKKELPVTISNSYIRSLGYNYN